MMMNPLGKIQNNGGITEFANKLKRSERQYKTLNKEEEREIVESFVEIRRDSDGNDVLDQTDPMYGFYESETDETKRRNLYHLVRRELVWKKPEEELVKLLVMHNIRFVFNISKKYCKGTRDFDNMVERGLYGLVKAANKFYPFMPVSKKDPNATEEEKKTKRDRIVQFDENGKTSPIKFCTYAKNWIFKYVVQEFQKTSVKNLDNMSISLDATIQTKGGSESRQTVENYIDSIVSPSYNIGQTIEQRLSEHDASRFYEHLQKYIENTAELTSFEKKVVTDIYYNNMKVSEIADVMNLKVSVVNRNRANALMKIKEHMFRKYDIMSSDQIC